MKKILCILLCMVAIFAFAGCGGGDKEDEVETVYTYEIGFLTPSAELSIDDEDYVEAAWNGVRQFAEANGKTYKYYEPETADTKGQVARIGDAVEAGAKVIVAVGPEVKDAIAEAQGKYQDVTFIYVDGELDDIAKNCVTVNFNPLQAGFLAGFAATIEGYGNMGYLADGESAESVAYGYGFVQGCNEAAMRFGRYAVIHYDYGSADASQKDIQKTAKSWYESGVNAIFTYGGTVFQGVKEEADKADKVVIASNGSKDYSDVVVTSARKCYEEVVAEQLKSIYEGGFQGGKNLSMSAKNDGVGLDMKASKFQYFNKDMYNVIYKELAKGDIELADEKDAKTVEELIQDQGLYHIRVEEQ